MLIVTFIVVVFYTGVLDPALWRRAVEKPRVAATDPFAYCKGVGTVDEPDAGYAGPKVPESIARGLQSAFQVPSSAPLTPFVENSFWRCMDGKVYACSVGANLPCMIKADTSRDPSTAVVNFCAANREVSAIPMAVTGRATVYAWQCVAGKPVIIRSSVKPDRRGFLSNIWYEISEQKEGPASAGATTGGNGTQGR